jgi:hypothetical protein
MDGSAKRRHYPYDPCGGTNPPFYHPTTGHDDEGLPFEVDPTRVDRTASHSSVTPP